MLRRSAYATPCIHSEVAQRRKRFYYEAAKLERLTRVLYYTPTTRPTRAVYAEVPFGAAPAAARRPVQ